jgi:hypothetical protein
VLNFNNKHKCGNTVRSPASDTVFWRLIFVTSDTVLWRLIFVTSDTVLWRLIFVTSDTVFWRLIFVTSDTVFWRLIFVTSDTVFWRLIFVRTNNLIPVYLIYLVIKGDDRLSEKSIGFMVLVSPLKYIVMYEKYIFVKCA